MSPTFERIAVGDLVQIVRSASKNVGKIGTVESYAGDNLPTFTEGRRWWVRFPRALQCCWGFWHNPAPIREEWLKRIPPLSELELTRTEEQMKEPA